MTDHPSVVHDEFVALVGTAPRDAPGSLLGIEQEFTVRTRAGWPVDFAELFPDLDVHGSDALDPSLPGARRSRSGAVLSADGREAEVAVPPVVVGPGFAGETAAWGRVARRELAALVPDSFALSGYSTHLSVSIDDARSPAVAGLYTRSFALGLMLLVDRATSPGLIVRPRPGRLELCGEFVDGAQLHAAAAYAVGSALACHGAVTGRRSFGSIPSQLETRTRPAAARAGWFVDRAAFSADVLEHGRAARLRRCDGLLIRAQEHLEAAWSVARQELVDLVDTDDLAITDAVVDGTRGLPSEDHARGDDPTDAAREPESSPLGRAARPRVRPSFWILATASTWNVTVFQIGSRVAPRDAYATIPRAQLGRFLDLIDCGDLDDVVSRYLATPATGRVVAASGPSPSIGDVPPTAAAVTERERDAALVARLPGSEARLRKRAGAIAPTAPAGHAATVDAATVGAATNGGAAADGRAGAGALPPTVPPERRKSLVPAGRWITVAGAALIVIAIAVVVLLSGGGDNEPSPTPTKLACGSKTVGAQISLRAVLLSCAYTTSQLRGAEFPYSFAQMPFRDAKIDVSAPTSGLVFGTPCPVHDATPSQLEQAKDPLTGFIGRSYIGIPVAGLPPGALLEVMLRAPDGSVRTGRGVADERGYAEARVPINVPEPHLIMSARYFPTGKASGTFVDITPGAISPSGVIEAALPGFHCDPDALLARVAAPSGDTSAVARDVIRNSAAVFPILGALVRPGADIDVNGPWTVTGAADGLTVRGGDVAFPFKSVTSTSEREQPGIAPVKVIHHGGTTIGPSGGGAGIAWQHALPCGAGQLALTVCP